MMRKQTTIESNFDIDLCRTILQAKPDKSWILCWKYWNLWGDSKLLFAANILTSWHFLFNNNIFADCLQLFLQRVSELTVQRSVSSCPRGDLIFCSFLLTILISSVSHVYRSSDSSFDELLVFVIHSIGNSLYDIFLQNFPDFIF